MEDEIKNEDLTEETDTEETSPESQETEETKEKSEETKEKDIDFKKELEKVQPQTKSELEKAQKALHFNAQRLVELGGDPAEVLKLKRETKKDNADVDVKSVIQREFIERDVRAMSKNEDHFKLMMHYVDDKKLSAEDAYVLSMKGQILRSITEIKRAGVQYAKPDTGGRKVDTVEVPERSHEEVAILERRGMRFNPKTKTYQGKFYEEYYDSTEKAWKSRKLVR